MGVALFYAGALPVLMVNKMSHTTNLDQRLQVYRILDAEQNKASKAARKAKAVYDSYGSGYDVERETAAVLLTLRLEQFNAACKVAKDYFDSYIKDAA